MVLAEVQGKKRRKPGHTMERNEIASQDSRLFAKSEFGPASDLTVIPSPSVPTC